MGGGGKGEEIGGGEKKRGGNRWGGVRYLEKRRMVVEIRGQILQRLKRGIKMVRV